MNTEKKVVYAATFASVFVLAHTLLQADFSSFLRWWLTLLIVGLAVLPMTISLFRGFHDQGYLFSKPIGIAITGYLLWLLSSIKIFQFTSMNGMICVALIALVNIGFMCVFKKGQALKEVFKKEAVVHFLNEELIFLVLFVIWCYIKGFKAEAYGTEKFMDYGFMTSMMRSKYMPPYDMWYSGGTINYYYLGQYFATFVTKISGVAVNHGYNLMLMTIASMSMVLPYSIVYNISNKMITGKQVKKSSVPVVSGVLSGLLLGASSNMHYPIFRFFVPAIQEMLGLETKSYWFPDATRYIGYHPDTSDKTIHEFPSYSSVLGDLHAHYINIIFVLTVVALLFAWYLRQEQSRLNQFEKGNGKLTKKLLVRELFEPGILMITFFIGIFHMTNFWDYPIYFVVSGAVILFSNAITFGFNKRVWVVTLLQGAVVWIGSSIVALPFTLHFDQISTEICIASTHTVWYQLLVLWGLPVFISVVFIMSCIRVYNHTKKVDQNEKKGVWKQICDFIENLEFTDLFVIVLALCAMGLVLMPELIYVKDIYSAGYMRANTMFKLTYQAFILFSLCNGYIMIKLIVFGTTAYQKRAARVAFVLSVITITYLGHSVKVWFGNIFDFNQRGTLDAAAFINEKFEEDADLIAWLNANIKGHAVVLEADGDSYSDYERVSAVTGLATVSGWGTHEWLWRGDREAQNTRNADVQTIYTSTDLSQVQQLVNQYEIDYIYVGNLERRKYETVSDDILMSLGEVVISQESMEFPEHQNYIVKVVR